MDSEQKHEQLLQSEQLLKLIQQSQHQSQLQPPGTSHRERLDSAMLSWQVAFRYAHGQDLDQRFDDAIASVQPPINMTEFYNDIDRARGVATATILEDGMPLPIQVFMWGWHDEAAKTVCVTVQPTS